MSSAHIMVHNTHPHAPTDSHTYKLHLSLSLLLCCCTANNTLFFVEHHTHNEKDPHFSILAFGALTFFGALTKMPGEMEIYMS